MRKYVHIHHHKQPPSYLTPAAAVAATVSLPQPSARQTLTTLPRDAPRCSRRRSHHTQQKILLYVAVHTRTYNHSHTNTHAHTRIRNRPRTLVASIASRRRRIHTESRPFAPPFYSLYYPRRIQVCGKHACSSRVSVARMSCGLYARTAGNTHTHAVFALSAPSAKRVAHR